MTSKNIPLDTILQTLAKVHEHWHAEDYFISGDEVLATGNLVFRPDYYALFICVAGYIKGSVNQQPIELVPYCFTATTPETVVQVTELSPDCKGRFLFFTKAFLIRNIIHPSLLEAFHFISEQVGFCLPVGRKDALVLLQLYDILKEKRDELNTAYHVEIIRSLFFTFLYEAAAIYTKKTDHPRYKIKRELELHQKFSELLVEHDKAEHHLKFYADSLFITPQYLIQAIRHASGKTPGVLIDETIVAEAKLLLHAGGKSIAAIAEELHFSDQAAFSKFFKRHSGLSPSSFRRKFLP
jgi:AraC family 4-hydroxyphenylacetate 3-monooxygenase operon regulatory protein